MDELYLFAHTNLILALFTGCYANVAFADSLTRSLLDYDDNRSLNRAHKILNEDINNNKLLNRNVGEKRQIDSDYKDLSIIKWTKSAVNLHNNHLGRQVSSACLIH